MERYQLAVVGAGPGGYVAAARAAELGIQVVCIDKGNSLGGTCLNVGCIPSKALLHSTELFEKLSHQGSEMGILAKGMQPDLAKMMARKKGIVDGLCKGVEGLFKQKGVEYLQGQAEFLDTHRLLVGNKEIEADWILLATGSEPIALPGIPFDQNIVLSSTEALSLREIPKRLLVVGGGAIGLELASVYQRLGSKVTVVEMMDRLCPAMDLSLSKAIAPILSKKMEIHLSTKVVAAAIQSDEAILTIEKEGQVQMISGDKMLIAVGRKPFTGGLGLEKVGIKPTDRGFIPVDPFFKTSVSHIFAIGDLIDGPMLAHKASEEGVAVVESLKGHYHPVNYLAIPNVVYTQPELASVGFTEEEAKEKGFETASGIAYFKANPRARCMGETDGFVKMIGDKKTGRVLGMHIIGPLASELIGEGMVAMQKGLFVKDLADAPHAHPTLSEAIKEAAIKVLN